MTEEVSLEATAPMPWRQAVMTVPLVRIATLLAAAAGLLHGCSAGYVPVFLGLLRNMAAASGPAAMDCPVSNASSGITGDGIVPSSCFEGSGDGTIEWSTMQQGLFAAAHVVGAFIGPLVVGRVITFVTDRVARSEDIRAAKALTADDGHEGSSTVQHRNDNNNNISTDITSRNNATIHQAVDDSAASSSIDVALVPFHAATKVVIACLFAGVALMALGRGVRQYAVLLVGRIAWGMGSGGMRFVAPLFAYAVAEEHIARQISALIEPATQLGIALNVAYGLIASRGFFLGTPTAMEVGIQGTNAVDALFALGLCALLRYLIAHSRVPSSSTTVGEPNENAAAEDEIEKTSLIPASHDATHRPPLNAAIVAAADNASFTSVTAASLRGIALPPSDWLNGGPSAAPPQAPPALRFDLNTPPSMLPPRSHGKSVSYDLPPAVSALSVDHKTRDGALPAAASMERQQHSSHGQRTGGDIISDPHTHNTHNTHSHLGVGAASYGTAAQHRIHSLRRLINHMASPLTCAADAPPVARSFTTASYGTITAHGTPSMMSYAAHHQRSFGRTPMQHPQRNGMAPVSTAASRAQQHQDPNALYPQTPHEQPRPLQVLGGKSAALAAPQPPHSFLESMEMRSLPAAGQNPHGDLMSLGTDMTFITPLPTPAAADARRLPVSLPTSGHKGLRQESQWQGMAGEGDDVEERCSPNHSLLDHRSPGAASGASHGHHGDHGLFPSTPLVSVPDLRPVAQSSPSGADHMVANSSPQEVPQSIGQRELTTTAVFEAANDDEDATGAGEGMSCVVVQEELQEVSDLPIEHVSLFTKVTRLLLGFVVAAPFILTGSTGLASYMTTYGDAIYGVPNMAAPFVLCGTALPFGVLGIALKRWVSARKLMLIGCVGVSVGQATIGTAALPGVVASTSASNAIALLGAIVFVASHQACVGASFFELAISIMPVPMRGVGSSVLSAVVAVYAVAVNFTFPLLVASLGAGDEVRGYALCCYGFAAIGVLSFVILFAFMHPIPVKGYP